MSVFIFLSISSKSISAWVLKIWLRRVIWFLRRGWPLSRPMSHWVRRRATDWPRLSELQLKMAQWTKVCALSFWISRSQWVVRLTQSRKRSRSFSQIFPSTLISCYCSASKATSIAPSILSTAGFDVALLAFRFEFTTGFGRAALRAWALWARLFRLERPSQLLHRLKHCLLQMTLT